MGLQKMMHATLNCYDDDDYLVVGYVYKCNCAHMVGPLSYHTADAVVVAIFPNVTNDLDYVLNNQLVQSDMVQLMPCLW